MKFSRSDYDWMVHHWNREDWDKAVTDQNDANTVASAVNGILAGFSLLIVFGAKNRKATEDQLPIQGFGYEEHALGELKLLRVTEVRPPLSGEYLDRCFLMVNRESANRRRNCCTLPRSSAVCRFSSALHPVYRLRGRGRAGAMHPARRCHSSDLPGTRHAEQDVAIFDGAGK